MSQFPRPEKNSDVDALLNAGVQESSPIGTYTRTSPSTVFDTISGAPYQVERAFNTDGQLIALFKSNENSQSETRLDPETGRALTVLEVTKMPDDNVLRKHINYVDKTICYEDVSITNGDGKLVRTIHRKFSGSQTVFQGETNYRSNGTPLATLHYYCDPEVNTSYREQIVWTKDSKCASIEGFSFSSTGLLEKHKRTIYSTLGVVEQQEILELNTDRQRAVRRYVYKFDKKGNRTRLDAYYFDEDGSIMQRLSTIYRPAPGQ